MITPKFRASWRSLALSLLGSLIWVLPSPVAWGLEDGVEADEVHHPAENVWNASRGELQSRFEEACTLFEEGRFHKSSLALYELTQSALAPSLGGQVRYLLGRSLEALEMPLAAERFYREAVLLSPIDEATYGVALTRWSALAWGAGDPDSLSWTLLHLSPESDPPDAIGLDYLRGRRLLDDRSLAEARVWLQRAGNPETLIGRRALYLFGVAATLEGDLESAYGAFEVLIRGVPDGVDGELSAKERETSERLRSLGLMGMARVRYRQGRLDDASSLYGRVPSDAYDLSQANYERAWVAFAQDSFLEAAELLAPYQLKDQSAGDHVRFQPEAELLASLLYISTEQFDLADGLLRAYLNELYEVRVALRDFLTELGGEAHVADVGRLIFEMPVLELFYFEIEAEDEVQPEPAADWKEDDRVRNAVERLQPLLDDIRRDVTVDAALARWERAAAEHEVAGRQFLWWQESELAEALQKYWQETMLQVQQELGSLAQRRLTEFRLTLSGHNIAALALRREVTRHRMACITRESQENALKRYEGHPLPPLDFIHSTP